jgi:hypothetical protein
MQSIDIDTKKNCFYAQSVVVHCILHMLETKTEQITVDMIESNEYLRSL